MRLPPRITPSELALWGVLAALACVLAAWQGAGSLDNNDAVQYASETDALIAGRGPRTGIVYYDAEYEHALAQARGGGACAPVVLTTFPPGYPLASAALRRVGVARVTALVAVSVVSFVLLVPLAGALAVALGAGAHAARLGMFLVATNHELVRAAVRVNSDALFALIVTATMWLHVSARAREAVGRRAALALHALTGFTLGLAVGVRFAALAVIVPYGLIHLYHGLRRRPSLGYACAAAAGLTLSLGPGLGMLYQVTGRILGGVDKPIVRPTLDALNEVSLAITGVAAGYEAVKWPLPWHLVAFAIGAIAVGAWAWSGTRGAPRPGAIGLSVIVVGYVLAVFDLGKYSPLLVEARLFNPVLALALALIVSWRGTPTRWGWRAALVGAGLIAASQLAQPYQATNFAAEADALTRVGAQGSALDWLDAHVARDAPIVAAPGHVFAELTHRPTLGVPEAAFTRHEWDEARLEAVVKTCRVAALVILRDPTLGAEASPALARLRAGQVPGWLTQAAETPGALIFVPKVE